MLKNYVGPENLDGPHVWDREERSLRMLKKFKLSHPPNPRAETLLYPNKAARILSISL